MGRRSQSTEPVLRTDSPEEFTLFGDKVWITVEKLSIHIHKTDEGVVVDIWPLGCEDADGPVASTYAFFEEGEDERCL